MKFLGLYKSEIKLADGSKVLNFCANDYFGLAGSVCSPEPDVEKLSNS
ncbi:hypothetical protein X745_30630 [Mesorhizobium sp. LNJC374B00]|nr:hypothetical protein X745_30630 [Mesorhizobium sp. LNJC374B00]